MSLGAFLGKLHLIRPLRDKGALSRIKGESGENIPSEELTVQKPRGKVGRSRAW